MVTEMTLKKEYSGKQLRDMYFLHGVILIAAGIIRLESLVNIPDAIFVGLVALVCLVVSLIVSKRANKNEAVAGIPIIKEQLGDITVYYETAGVTSEDVKLALDSLKDWKIKNNFTFVENPDDTLLVIFKDDKKDTVEIIKATDIGKHTDRCIAEYHGVVKYYMKDGKRYVKVGEVQLGELNLGVVNSIEAIANKTCHLWINTSKNMILDYSVDKDNKGV